MTDFAALLELCATIALVVVPIIVISWLLAGSDGPGLADIFAIPAGPPLPRGVQEQEPVRWRVERLTRPAPERTATAPHRAPSGRPVVESGPCR